MSPAFPSWSARSGASLLAIVLALTAIAGLELLGRSARASGPAVALAGQPLPLRAVKDSASVYRSWKLQGARGRVVVHFGRFLHFEANADAEHLVELLDSAGSGQRTTAQLEAAADRRSFLWVAAQSGVARRIVYRPPAEVLEKKHADRLALDADGFPRTALARLPALDEPALVNIDASFFEGPSAPDLAAELRSSGLRADMITLCFAEDDPAVTPQARDRLRQLARDLSGKELEPEAVGPP